MEDKLKKYIHEHRDAFDLTEAPDVWTSVYAGLHFAPWKLIAKHYKAMLKFGFGASALVVGTFAVLHYTGQGTGPAKIAVPQKQSQPAPKSPPLMVSEVVTVEPITSIHHFYKTSAESVQAASDYAPTAVNDNETVIPQQENNFSSIPVATSRDTAISGLYDVDTIFTGVKQLEVTGLFCNVTVRAVNSDQVKFKGRMNATSCEGLVIGNYASSKKAFMIRYVKEGDLLRVYIDKEKQKEKSDRDTKEESFLDFEVPLATGLKLRNSSGNITVTGARGKSDIRTEFGNITAEDLECETRLSTSSGNIHGARITGKFTSVSSYGNQNFSELKGQVDLRSSSGNIKVQGLQGGGVVSSSYGHQTLIDVEGDVQASASSGNIRIQRLKGNLKASCSFGTQEYEDIEGDIVSKASSGNIKINGSKGALNLGTSYGSIKGKNIMLVRDADCRASSGNINLELLNKPEDLRFDLASSSGHLDIEKGDIKLSSNKEAVIGKGPILVKGVTSFGNQHYR